MSSSNLYLGLDPGASGGLALIDEDCTVLALEPMPGSEVGIWEWFSTTVIPHYGITYVVLEKVQGFIGEDQPGSHMFKFGNNYGWLEMAITACGLFPKTLKITPSVWEKEMAVAPRHGDSKTQHKAKLARYARELFPEAKSLITNKTADALLLAAYCRMKQKGEL